MSAVPAAATVVFKQPGSWRTLQRRALDALAHASAAHAAWEAIQAPDQPALTSIASWGATALDRYR